MIPAHPSDFDTAVLLAKSPERSSAQGSLQHAQHKSAGSLVGSAAAENNTAGLLAKSPGIVSLQGPAELASQIARLQHTTAGSLMSCNTADLLADSPERITVQAHAEVLGSQLTHRQHMPAGSLVGSAVAWPDTAELLAATAQLAGTQGAALASTPLRAQHKPAGSMLGSVAAWPDTAELLTAAPQHAGAHGADLASASLHWQHKPTGSMLGPVAAWPTTAELLAESPRHGAAQDAILLGRQERRSQHAGQYGSQHMPAQQKANTLIDALKRRCVVLGVNTPLDHDAVMLGSTTGTNHAGVSQDNSFYTVGGCAQVLVHVPSCEHESGHSAGLGAGGLFSVETEELLARGSSEPLPCQQPRQQFKPPVLQQMQPAALADSPQAESSAASGVLARSQDDVLSVSKSTNSVPEQATNGANTCQLSTEPTALPGRPPEPNQPAAPEPQSHAPSVSTRESDSKPGLAPQQAEGSNTESAKGNRRANFFNINGRRYIKMMCIGKGGFGRVYMAMGPDGNICAVKDVDLTIYPELADELRQEVELLKRLTDEPSIVRQMDSQDFGDRILMVLEYAESDLSTRLVERAAACKKAGMDLTEDVEFVRWTLQMILQAIAVAHRFLLIHLDLKPSNFLVVKGCLKLADFGISMAIAEDATTTSVVVERPKGSIGYMAPEVVRAGGKGKLNIFGEVPKLEVRRSADVWSLGCILFEMLWGRTPYPSVMDPLTLRVISSVLAVDIPKLANKHLRSLVRRCLDKNAKTRITLQGLLVHPFVQPRSSRHPTLAPAATPFEKAVRLLKAILQAAAAAGMDGAKLQLLAVELQSWLFGETADSSRIAALLDAGQLQTVKEAVSALLDSSAGSGLRLLRFKDCSQTGTACLRRPAGILLTASDSPKLADGISTESHPSGMEDSRPRLPAVQSAAEAAAGVPELLTSPQAAGTPSGAAAESDDLDPTAQDAAVLSELVNSLALGAAGADVANRAADGHMRADTCSLVCIGSVNLKGHGLRRTPNKHQGASGALFEPQHTPALQAAGMNTRQLLAADDKENVEGLPASTSSPQQQPYDVSLVNLGASWAALQQTSRSHIGADAVAIDGPSTQQAVKGSKTAARGLAAATRSSTAGRSSAASAASLGLPKAQPPFFFFCAEQRPDLQAKEPGLRMVDGSKALSAMWKSLSAADKLPYEAAAAADKERVKAEAAALNASVTASLEHSASMTRARRSQMAKAPAELANAAPEETAAARAKAEVNAKNRKAKAAKVATNKQEKAAYEAQERAEAAAAVRKSARQKKHYSSAGSLDEQSLTTSESDSSSLGAAAAAAAAAWTAGKDEIAIALSPALAAAISQQAWAAAGQYAAANRRPKNITVRERGGFQVKFEAAAKPGFVNVGLYYSLQSAVYARAVSALVIYGEGDRVPTLIDSSVFTKEELDAAHAYWDQNEAAHRVKSNIQKELAKAAVKATAKAVAAP